mgnify:CR=1 FL=1
MAIGAILGGVGLAYNIYQTRQAGIQERKAQKAQKRINTAQEVRKRRATIREAQVATANTQVVAAANGGGGQSSNILAAQSSVGAQLASNLNFLSSTSAESKKATNALATSARMRSQGALANSIGNFALNNSDRIDNLFD